MFLFRWIFRDPKVDVRFLALGALLPDLIDLPLGTVVFAGTVSTGQAWAHSLLAPSVVTVAILLATRRGRRRRAWMALAVGMFFHLLLDGMWTQTEVFLWPFFGSIPQGPAPYWAGAWERAMSDPWRWVRELLGLAYLTGVWITTGMSNPARRRTVVTTGRLEDV
ncbi:MAG TPA: metal-dependent hydrolase [Acidimicrobiia bacterium]|nr:metal-dependent hydrolase [Acidimicrobiia bacterium]